MEPRRSTCVTLAILWLGSDGKLTNAVTLAREEHGNQCFRCLREKSLVHATR